MDDELSKLANFGVKPEQIEQFQIFCLPENTFSYPVPTELVDAADSIYLAKHLKASGIQCCTGFDLGLKPAICERRSVDRWFGLVWIKDKIALPVLATTLAKIITSKIEKVLKAEKESPPEQVHMELYVNEKSGITRISYKGDGKTLIKVVKSLEDGESK